LVHESHRFGHLIPSFQPHFLNLREMAPATLTQEGGIFGHLLWLLRERKTDAATFRRTLEAVLAKLERMGQAERVRWSELLSYVLALVYHARSGAEQQPLRAVVDSAVQTDQHRQEYTKMTKTIADVMKDEGRQEGKQEGELTARQEILLRHLRKRFKKVPRRVEARIAATTDLQELDGWLDNLLDATTLADVGILPH
jgi:ElaB/YqjD/DUF883 family membrane-anchored ribosome-binding protein